MLILVIGTKENQRILTNLDRLKKATVNALRRYNELCDKLKALLPHGLEFPLPEKLDIEKGSLKNDPRLLEDVWIGVEPEKRRVWLVDEKARNGIRAMHELKRCQEESTRIADERDALCSWVLEQWQRLQLALEDRTSEPSFVTPLQCFQLCHRSLQTVDSYGEGSLGGLGKWHPRFFDFPTPKYQPRE
jgi:hypothetical protein